jgi:hypothetical protein
VANFLSDAAAGVLLGNGDGTFQPKLDTPTRVFLQMQSMQVGDIDGDGKLDAVVGVPEGIFVTPGKGDGTFDVTLKPAPSGTAGHCVEMSL